MHVGRDAIGHPGKNKKAMNVDPPLPAPSLALECIVVSSPRRKGTVQPSVSQLTLFILTTEQKGKLRPLSYKDM